MRKFCSVIAISRKQVSVMAATVMMSLAVCAGARAQTPSASNTAPTAAGGEMIYVPIYSRIFYEDGKYTLSMAATLSIHNVDPDHSITITRADYYDTQGKLIKKYIAKPQVLTALQTINVVVEKNNSNGGTGANFIVEWQSTENAVSPLVEAVMINASSNLGIAFTTSGRVVRKSGLAAK